VTYKKAILKWIASCEFKTVTVNKNMLVFFRGLYYVTVRNSI